MHSSWRQRPPPGWPLARIFPQPTQPRYGQSGFGQKWVAVFTCRRRPSRGTSRGGGAEGTGRRRSEGSSQAAQCGLWVRPAKGLGSRVRFGSAEEDSGVVEHAAGSLGHAQWSRSHSHTRAMSTNWENKRAEIMAKPPPTGGERGVFYPIFIAAELAAGYRYTTIRRA